MFSLADSNFYYLSFFMNTGPGVTLTLNLRASKHTGKQVHMLMSIQLLVTQ